MPDFVPYRGELDAPIVIVGSHFNAKDAAASIPFETSTEPTKELERILAAAHIDIKDCLFLSLIPKAPPRGDIKNFFISNAQAKKLGLGQYKGCFPTTATLDYINDTLKTIDLHSRKIVIALGNLPLWALTDNSFSVTNTGGYKLPAGIGRWRGSQIYYNNTPLLPTHSMLELFRQWELRPRIIQDFTRAWMGSKDGAYWKRPEKFYTIRPTYNEVLTILDSWYEVAEQKLEAQSTEPLIISDDIETRNGKIMCIGLGISKNSAICIPFRDGSEPYWSLEEEWEVRKAIRAVLTHPMVAVIGQNFTYDIQYQIDEFLGRPRVAMDTMNTHHLLFPGTPKGLDYLSSLYCEHHTYWKDEGKDWDGKRPMEQLWTYNCNDVVATYEIYEVLKALVQNLGMQEQFARQNRQFDLVTNLMLRGVSIDKKIRADMAMHLISMIEERKQWLEEIMPEDIWPRKPKASAWYASPAQLSEIFYEVLGQPQVKSTKTFRPTTDDEALTKLAQNEPLLRPICETIQELRSLGVFFNTFIEAPLDPDGRMRCSYNISGTETFRWSSNKNAYGRGTNLQNIPKGTEDD